MINTVNIEIMCIPILTPAFVFYESFLYTNRNAIIDHYWLNFIFKYKRSSTSRNENSLARKHFQCFNAYISNES